MSVLQPLLLKRSHFHYQLPEDLIAQHPLAERTDSRLLVLDPLQGIRDQHFCDLPDWLAPGDLLVFNNTRVMNARLYGRKSTGGGVEILVERILDSHSLLAHIRASKSPRPGGRILLDGDSGSWLEVQGRVEDLYVLVYAGSISLDAYMEQSGHLPLPPYISRPDSHEDAQRYQTVYASEPGAIAAPTAGLHFDTALLARLQNQGIETAEVTLHVGSGTFRPIRSEYLQDHTMHSEYGYCPEETVARVHATRARGGRVVAVGTTVVRCLESASRSGELLPWSGDTSIFIYQGYRFRSVDALITNFHLPESTLLALVCAFAGHDAVMQAYAHAIASRYRFFSYGDAMLLAHARDE
ncbi:MAG: hypothetical protein RIQ52_537 [Pseudomonadota bacterium]|jgi:S-adenosylmethionine:tRNA ribosyltransferase-isomerase